MVYIYFLEKIHLLLAEVSPGKAHEQFPGKVKQRLGNKVSPFFFFFPFSWCLVQFHLLIGVQRPSIRRCRPAFLLRNGCSDAHPAACGDAAIDTLIQDGEVGPAQRCGGLGAI